MNENMRGELVRLATSIRDRHGIDALVYFRHYQGACACMGPQNGDTLCPCRQSAALEANLADVLPEVDPEEGRIMILRQIASIL